MKTVTVQIGNSDDKLTQIQWSQFLWAVSNTVENCSCQVHFSGVSDPHAPWQNAAWVFAIGDDDVEDLKTQLSLIRAQFRQDSIAWTEGDTAFI